VGGSSSPTDYQPSPIGLLRAVYLPPNFLRKAEAARSESQDAHALDEGTEKVITLKKQHVFYQYTENKKCFIICI